MAEVKKAKAEDTCTASPWKRNNMADPMADLDELDAINAKREAQQLPPFDDIAPAREWLAGQAGEEKAVETAAEVKTETAQPDAKADEVFAPPPAAVKAASENTREAELEKEVQRLKSEAGRSSVLAKELKDLQARADAAELRAQEAEQKAADAASKAAGGGLFGFLTPEQREAMDENALAAIEKGVSQYVQKAVSAVEAKTGSEIAEAKQMVSSREERERQREAEMLQARVTEMWRDKIAPVIPSSVYGTFATQHKAKWAEWCARTYAGRQNADLYNDAVASLDHEALIELMTKFMRFSGIEVPAKVSRPPLKPNADHGSATPATEEKGPKTYFADEVNTIEDEYLARKRLPSGWTADTFSKWSAEIDKARYEGRVLDRSSGRPVYD